MFRIFAGAMVILMVCSVVAMAQKQPRYIPIKKEVFGTVDGTPVYLFTLKNSKGMEAKITNYGGIIVSLLAPDKDGKFDDIVLGFDSLTRYFKNDPYFGALVGRYGNRIAGAKFSLDGKEYTLAKNNGPNTLHGGIKGFNKMVWDAKMAPVRGTQTLVLTYLSKDGEEGYPGNLNVKVVYSLTSNNELKIQYTATTDKPTVLNLTSHSYFNLKGAGNGDILDHLMMINANRFTPVDSTLIPTGELKKVDGTPFDFRKPTPIGERINADDEQIKLGRGYDHNFVLNKKGSGLSLAAKVSEKSTGRVMEVLTTEPGVQFYTGNFLDGTLTGKDGKVYNQRYGFCLETQHFPDSPNHPDFPTTELKPGKTFSSTTIYKFSTEK